MGFDLFINEDSLDSSPHGWMWVKPLEDRIELWSSDTEYNWSLRLTLLKVDAEGNVLPNNLQFKNVNIKGNLFVNGDSGANANVTAGGIHMIVKEGIITTLEEV